MVSPYDRTKGLKLTVKEKDEIAEKFSSGEMSVHRFCGRVVKFGDRMMYKIMAPHKCKHGKPCWANRKSGCNVPKKWYCEPCYDSWEIRYENRRKAKLFNPKS
jgi:hypothetical protein